jgi:hypothetical protein
MSPSATRRSASEAIPSKPTRLLAPFHVPADSEIFALRAQQRRDRARERQSLQETRYYLRGTTSDRESFRPLTQVPPPRISAEEEALAQLILSPDSSEPSEGLHDFIDQKRDIFLAQLAIDTKREELQRLERLEREEQDRLDAQEAEITLFRDQFRAFLDADARALSDAHHAADSKAKLRGEISTRIRQISLQNASLRNDIASLEEKLQECESFRDFIEGLTPPDWRRAHPLPELYFKAADQMLDILRALEEQNLFLSAHCQEAEEAIERTKATFIEILENRDGGLLDRQKREGRRSSGWRRRSLRRRPFEWSGSSDSETKSPSRNSRN